MKCEVAFIQGYIRIQIVARHRLMDLIITAFSTRSTPFTTTYRKIHQCRVDAIGQVLHPQRAIRHTSARLGIRGYLHRRIERGAVLLPTIRVAVLSNTIESADVRVAKRKERNAERTPNATIVVMVLRSIPRLTSTTVALENVPQVGSSASSAAAAAPARARMRVGCIILCVRNFEMRLRGWRSQLYT